MLVENYSSGFLAVTINSSVTSISVNPGHSLPTTPGIFTAIIWNSSSFSAPSQDPNAEIIWGQYSSPNTYTITRGMEGTVGVAHAQGALIGLYITAGVLSIPYVKVSNTQTPGTAGGTATSGSWGTVPLNTKDNDTSGIATLASNQITLPAGTYKVRGFSTFFQTNNSQIRLYNVTGSAAILYGQVVYPIAAGPGVPSIISGQIILNVQSTLSLQYQVQQTVSTTGLGESGSFGPEVYANLEFEMINT